MTLVTKSDFEYHRTSPATLLKGSYRTCILVPVLRFGVQTLDNFSPSTTEEKRDSFQSLVSAFASNNRKKLSSTSSGSVQFVPTVSFLQRAEPYPLLTRSLKSDPRSGCRTRPRLKCICSRGRQPRLQGLTAVAEVSELYFSAPPFIPPPLFLGLGHQHHHRHQGHHVLVLLQTCQHEDLERLQPLLVQERPQLGDICLEQVLGLQLHQPNTNRRPKAHE